MLTSQIVVLALSASAFGAVIKRDFAQFYKDSQTLTTDANNLKTAVNNYDGSLGKSLALNSVGNTYQNDMSTTTTDCKNSAAFTSAQCTQELNYMTNTYEPAVKAALAAIKSKKATFTANGLKSNIQDNLNKFQTANSGITSCIKSKCPSAQASAAASMTSKMDADFADAINYYKS